MFLVSYYNWCIKGCEAYNKFKKAHEELKTSVLKAYKAARSIYGAPRLTRELHEQGINISQATVGRLMSDLSIQGAKGRTKIITTRSCKYKRLSNDLVQRNFTVTQPDTLWVSDLTYIKTNEGWLYLVCVMDAFSRRILGSAIGETMETKLFISSFNRAKATRQKAVLPTTIFHSDHGSQYLSDQFREVIRISKVTQSMGAIGDSYDNAMAISLWASLKKELVYKKAFKTREEAKAKIFDWINWYNNRRRHSGIGYLSPICYEQAMMRQAA